MARPYIERQRLAFTCEYVHKHVQVAHDLTTTYRDKSWKNIIISFSTGLVEYIHTTTSLVHTSRELSERTRIFQSNHTA
jgi:hypothetical protein